MVRKLANIDTENGLKRRLTLGKGEKWVIAAENGRKQGVKQPRQTLMKDKKRPKMRYKFKTLGSVNFVSQTPAIWGENKPIKANLATCG